MSQSFDLTGDDFFIGGEKFSLRYLQRHDFEFDFSSTSTLPEATDNAIQFGEKLDTSVVDLSHIYQMVNPTAGAFTVLKEDLSDDSVSQPVSYAVYGLNRIYQSHQFCMSVDNALKISRLPTEILAKLINHAKEQGVKTLYCRANENNLLMRALAKRTRMSTRLDSDNSRCLVYSLMIDRHPGIVKF